MTPVEFTEAFFSDVFDTLFRHVKRPSRGEISATAITLINSALTKAKYPVAPGRRFCHAGIVFTVADGPGVWWVILPIYSGPSDYLKKKI